MLFRVRRGVWVISADVFNSFRFHSTAASFSSIGKALFLFFLFMALQPLNSYLVYWYIRHLFPEENIPKTDICAHAGAFLHFHDNLHLLIMVNFCISDNIIRQQLVRCQRTYYVSISLILNKPFRWKCWNYWRTRSKGGNVFWTFKRWNFALFIWDN